MKNKILNEITNFCQTCASKDYCAEDDCPLYRIENMLGSTKKQYKVRIEETLSQIITVKAKTKQEALDLVEERYKNEEIVLDDTNYVGYDVCVLERDQNEK